MRIVELITFLSSGGAERLVVDLSNQFAKEHDVYLVTILNDRKDAEIRNFYRSEISEKVHYVNLGLPNGLKLSSQWKVYKTLCDLKPDVVHLHMNPTLRYSALAVALRCMTKKVFFSIHSDLHVGYDRYDRGIVKFFCNTFGALKQFRLSCLSETNYRDFKDFYPHTTIRCIPNGRAPIVGSELFDSVRTEMNSYKTNQTSRLLIHVARCHKVKNQKLLVEAMNLLLSRGMNVDLVIIGAGFDSQEGDELKSMSSNRVHFLGTKKNIADYMLNADIFCLSSDYEGMSITLLEALLAGVPAVSTPVCGSVDLIQSGINGYLSKSHSLEDYADALKDAVDNFDVIKENALNMKDSSPYTIETCAKKYIEYFNA